MVDISIIVPALDEEAQLAAALASARAPAVREIIVVDGGSRDATAEIARGHADAVLTAARGRAVQMNAGAAAARGDVLLFLHADTRLPPASMPPSARRWPTRRSLGGRFDVSLVPSTPLLRLVAKLINVRSRLSRIATGDQAIFVRRTVFEQLGGFAPMPLMEDLAFTIALKRQGRVACLRERVETSSRRWLRDGPVRTILLMWWLRFLYFCGVSPARLRRRYADTR